MAKRWIVRLALATTLWVAILALLGGPALASAPATATCPAPGTGLAGALNMRADPTMGYIMKTYTAPQGDAGMKTAVMNTACP